MTTYVYIFHGGNAPSSEEEGKKMMDDWTAWLNDIGDAAVDHGTPMGKSVTVGPNDSVVNNGGADPASGYMLVQADSMDAAIELAKSCPFVLAPMEGRIEIAEAKKH